MRRTRRKGVIGDTFDQYLQMPPTDRVKTAPVTDKKKTAQVTDTKGATKPVQEK